jgi:hypothetical protein
VEIIRNYSVDEVSLQKPTGNQIFYYDPLHRNSELDNRKIVSSGVHLTLISRHSNMYEKMCKTEVALKIFLCKESMGRGNEKE